MEAMIWIGLIILFVVVEIATVGLTSIWFAGGALISLILCLCGVGLGWQIGVFFVVSMILVAFTRPWAMKYLKPHLIRTNYEQAIGENVCLTETVDNQRGTGTAVYKGQEWTARASEDGKRYEGKGDPRCDHVCHGKRTDAAGSDPAADRARGRII